MATNRWQNNLFCWRTWQTDMNCPIVYLPMLKHKEHQTHSFTQSSSNYWTIIMLGTMDYPGISTQPNVLHESCPKIYGNCLLIPMSIHKMFHLTAITQYTITSSRRYTGSSTYQPHSVHKAWNSAQYSKPIKNNKSDTENNYISRCLLWQR
jgi:hypothetical protein